MRRPERRDGDTVLIDCHHAGISGDMLVGALIDLGADKGAIAEEVKRCTEQVGKVDMRVREVRRASIACTKVDFLISTSQNHVHLKDCVERASDPWVRERSLQVIRTLEEAESRVHGTEGVSHPHLHEVGQLDAVADIVGTLTAWRNLALDRMEAYSTRVALGGGGVKFSHGDFPVPAPATLEILKGAPVSFGGERELSTPTGASLLVNLVDGFVENLDIVPLRVGLGAGKEVGEFLNATRLVLGTRDRGVRDVVDIIETSVDDVTPEVLAHSSQRLMEEGALDVSILPSLMKKGRPGNLVRIVCDPNVTNRLCDLLLAETGSLGARIYKGLERRKLRREVRTVSLQLGGKTFTTRIKVGLTGEGDLVSFKPEYADVARICEETGLEFLKVYRSILDVLASADILKSP